MPLVDTRLLGRPQVFAVVETEWPDWDFSFKAYTSAVDGAVSDLSATAAISATPISLVGSTADVPSRSKNLLCMLAMLTTGLALGIVRQAGQAEASNGLEAWRLLLARYEPNATSRVVALLSKIIDPDPFLCTAMGFEETLGKLGVGHLSMGDSVEFNTPRMHQDRHVVQSCTSRVADNATTPKSPNLTISS